MNDEVCYHYAQFVDETNGRGITGKIRLIGDPDIVSYDLKKDERGHYITTLEELGNLGWELVFVSPCGFRNLSYNSGPIENTYIFKKEEHLTLTKLSELPEIEFDGYIEP